MPNQTLALLMIAALPLLVSPAAAKVVLQEQTRVYDIDGRTGAALMRSIRKRAARGTRVRHAIATTQIEMELSGRSAIKGRSCRYRDVVVRLKLTYRIPRWRRKAGARPAVRKVWSRFRDQVIRHERKHGAIAKRYATRLDAALRNARPSARDCRRRGFAIPKLAKLSTRHERDHVRLDTRDSRANARIRRLERALARTR